MCSDDIRKKIAKSYPDKPLDKLNGLIEADEKGIKFREQNGQHIPYIELFNSDDITLPVEKIIVGPHAEKENRAASLRAMLRKTEIEITCSDIPYIGK